MRALTVVGLVATALVICGTLALGQADTPSHAAGMVLQDMDQATLDYFQGEIGYRGGVVVNEVAPGSAAAAAGLVDGDILAKVGALPVASTVAADAALRSATGTVQITILREGDDGVSAAVFALALGGATAAPAAPAGETQTSPQDATLPGIGLVLRSLPKEALDGIEKALGVRIGVVVANVAAGTPAATTGMRAGDILLGVGTQRFSSPTDAVAAFGNVTGAVEVFAMRRGADGKWQTGTFNMQIPTARPPVQPGAVTTPVGAPPQVSAASGDPVAAYFDMMDFVRTQAWGRTVSTSAAERQRVSTLVRQALAEADAETVSALNGLPNSWAELQRTWAGFGDANKAKQRAYWRRQLLLPTQLFPPPAQAKTYRAQGDILTFEYPSDWIQAEAEDDGTNYVFLAPSGVQTTWDKVGDPAASPGGALFAVAPIDDEMRQTKTYLEGARLIARRYVTPNGANMEEIFASDDKDAGGLIAMVGRYPGQSEDRFYWVGDVRFGPEHFLAIRFGGPVSQADALVPAFFNMLATLELNAPQGSGAGAAGFALGAQIIGNATVNAGWYATNHGE